MRLTKRQDYNGYMRRFMKRRYHRRRKKAIQELGGICISCGSKKKLEFDHRNPKSKSFGLWCRSVSEERFSLELKKCQLLCSKCHLLKTLSDLGRRLHKGTHGTLSAYPHCGPPKCKACKAAKAEWFRGYRKRLGYKPRKAPRHGTDAMYQRGCKCSKCLKVHREYQKKLRRKYSGSKL